MNQFLRRFAAIVLAAAGGGAQAADERDTMLYAGNVFFANINAALLHTDGMLSHDVMPDMLHPQDKGYRVLADAIGPDIESLLK